MSEEELEDLLSIGCCKYHEEIGEKAKKEIERLNKENNDLKALLKEYKYELGLNEFENTTIIDTSYKEDYERLNNIITELEKWLNKEKEATLYDYQFAIEDVLDKLKELKQGGSNESN